MATRIAGGDFDGWVDRLAKPTERQRARSHLLRCGPLAVPAVRRGLHHADPLVRASCAKLLDKLADDESVADLVAALDDPDPLVVRLALHSLACDECKEGECRRGDEVFVPRAMELLRTSEETTVRIGAIDALAQAARRNPALVDELLELFDRERDPGLRNLARQRLKRLTRTR
jgi:HEAT repeat protein